MTVFKFPTPPDCPVYDVQGDKWVPKLLFWECVSYPSEPKLPFYELLATYGPLSTLLSRGRNSLSPGSRLPPAHVGT